MKRVLILIVTVFAAVSFSGCGAMHDYYNMALAKKLNAEPVDDTPTDPETPVTPSPLFSFGLGNPVTPINVSDQDLLNDYDGDTILNSEETTTNPFVAEYPKIVTRIDTPISVEIRSDSTSSTDNYSESISGSETRDTLSNSMEDKQYTQSNRKTTPIPTKESKSDSSADSSSYGFSDSTSKNSGSGGGLTTPWGGANANSSKGSSTSHSENGSISTQLASSTSSETTVFQNVDYVDNLDRNGVEINSSKVKNMTSSFRNSEVAKNTTNIGPNAGVVSSCLHIHNLSVNYPVHISDVKCTLSFRMPSGQCQAVKTFTLRNDDYSVFSADVYGDEEKGPYAIVIDGLNTDFIRKALSNGWVPQIHVVDYKTSKVKDSNYDPGVDNLKIVEEKAKGRTSLISIKGQGIKESFRVSSFDVQPDGTFIPGISLKKALFNIMADRIGSGEKWTSDINGNVLTINDSGLKWMNGNKSGEHVYSSNSAGNSWRSFETYVKQYTDDTGKTCRIETIKRLYSLKKYNPFDPADNSSYNVSELMSNDDVEKMQFWMIYHDGKYFEGDINDPIWPGERYELVCVNIEDFNAHFRDYAYTPFQSSDQVSFNTRWNALSNDGEFARAMYLGQIIPNDIIHLKVGLEKTRNLFLGTLETQIWPGAGNAVVPLYTFASNSPDPTGIPKSFTHSARGGTNGIVVEIEPSENAVKYAVTINGPVSKTINVGYEVLAKNGNTVFIDRNTPTANSDVVKAGEYTVKVEASGKAYGSDVTTQSSNNNACSVNVEDPLTMPSGFTISADGSHSQMALCIGNSSNAEYFDGMITGPINYSEATATQDIKLHGGYNYLSIPVPSADRLYSINQPGLFKIHVRAQNSVSLRPGAVQSASNEMYVSIPYDLYAAQKDTSTRPKISSVLEKLGAVDLEINFNDGNGWFVLQTSGSDADFTGVQKVDCRFTSYIDYKSQVFDVYFSPPAGPTGKYPSSYNVFSGGRTVADVYLRTRAKPCYRDTFWPRTGSSISLLSNTGTSVVDLVRNLFWNANYDATQIEKRSQCTLSVSDPKLSAAGGKSDFFFAPALERSYAISAELVESFPGSPSVIPDTPTGAEAVAQEKAILVKNIVSGDGMKKFRIFYKAGTEANTEDIAGTWLEWIATEPASSGGNDPLGVHVTISNLTKNQPYMVAIYAFNEGKSSPSALIRGPVYPYGPVTQTSPMFTVTPQSVNRDQVLVSNIYLPGESRYQVWGKISGEGNDAVDSTWTLAYDSINDNSGKPCVNPVSHLFTALHYSTAYLFKSRVVSLGLGIDGNTMVGPWTSAVEVMTLAPKDAKPFLSVTVPPNTSTSVCVSLMGGQAYEVAYKEYADNDISEPGTWTDIKSIKETSPLSAAYSKVYDNLRSWTRYKFAARTVDFYTGSKGAWSDTYLVNTGVPSNVYTQNEATLNYVPFSNTTGVANVATSPFTLADIASYGICFYVSYDYSFKPMWQGSFAGSEIVGSGRAVYAADQLKAYGDNIVSRSSGEEFLTAPLYRYLPSNGAPTVWVLKELLSTIAGTFSSNDGRAYTETMFNSSVVGKKFIFHSKYTGVDDIVVVQGETW